MRGWGSKGREVGVVCGVQCVWCACVSSWFVLCVCTRMSVCQCVCSPWCVVRVCVCVGVCVFGPGVGGWCTFVWLYVLCVCV